MDDQSVLLPIICITLLIFLLVAGIIITFIVSGQRRNKQEIQLTQAKLFFERELRQVETEVSEQMMGQFAEELHDNIGQLLTAMHIQVENQKIDHPDLIEGFKPIEIYLGEVTQQLRLLSRTLNNDYIGHIGLLAALQLEVDRLRVLKRFQVHWTPVVGPSGLDKGLELMVFRIFQEIMQNALRHSGASNVSIHVDTSADTFYMEVKDDGKGFDVDGILQSQKASGLRNILKRSKLAGITCEIETSHGKGCLYKLKKISTLS